MSIVTTLANGYSSNFASDNSLFMRRKLQAAGEGPAVVLAHGRSVDATQYADSSSAAAPGFYAHLLAQNGYRVLSNDAVSTTHWGNANSEQAIVDAVAYLQGAGGAKSGKVALLGWSMGCVALLNYIKNHPTAVACAYLVAPVTDLDWAHVQAAWTAEIDTAYGANYALNAAGRSPIGFASSVRGCPITVVHAADDATVPLSQSQTFVSTVNDPSVTLTQVASGGHTGVWSGLDQAALRLFFSRNLPHPV